MSDLDKELQEIAERCEKATNGPWEVVPDIRPDIFVSVHTMKKGGYFNAGQLTRDTAFGLSDDGEKIHIAELSKYERNHSDAEFIAHARTDIEKLLAVVARLRGIISPTEARHALQEGRGQAGTNPTVAREEPRALKGDSEGVSRSQRKA